MPWLDNPCPPLPTVNERLDDILQLATSANETQVESEVMRVRGIGVPQTPNPEAKVAAAWAKSIAAPPDWAGARNDLGGIQ